MAPTKQESIWNTFLTFPDFFRMVKGQQFWQKGHYIRETDETDWDTPR